MNLHFGMISKLVRSKGTDDMLVLWINRMSFRRRSHSTQGTTKIVDNVFIKTCFIVSHNVYDVCKTNFLTVPVPVQKKELHTVAKTLEGTFLVLSKHRPQGGGMLKITTQFRK